ncbi:tyrosine-protein phosphatase [Chitinophagaceae bacterium MMS25-I14]
MWSLFRKTPKHTPGPQEIIDFSFLGCDMHSHLVPAIDDGSQSLEDSVELIRKFKEKGYKKLITTPHVYGEFYPNTRENILSKFQSLKRFIEDQRIQIDLQVSAEYYLDNYFLTEVLPHGLIPFGDNYVLVEVSMAGWPRNFSDLIFSIQSMGYKPILAHPERYQYEEGTEIYEDLKNRGVLLQMNLLSAYGYYGRGVKEQADKLMNMKLYDFCGSDLHHIRHMEKMGKMIQEHPELVHHLRDYGFRNAELLNN